MRNYVIYNPQGGTEGHSQQYATQLCLGLAANNVRVHLVTSRDFDPVDVLNEGIEVSYSQIQDSRKTILHYNSWLSKLKYGWFIVKSNVKSFAALNKAIHNKNTSACLLVGGDTLTNIIYLLCIYWRSEIIFALTIHNADYDFNLYKNDKVKLIYKIFSKFLLKLVLCTRVVIFVHGEAMRDALADQLNLGNSDRIHIYKVPTPAALKVDRPGLPRYPVRFLFCGVVRLDKGFDTLCEALSHCKPKNNWVLRVAGSVRQVGEEYVRDLVTKYGIKDNCSFNLKYLSDSEIDFEFQNSDIVLLPYRRGFIAQSVVMTDAMRWGRPVIASRHSQNGYDVLKYELGWTFTSEDCKSLELALSCALSNFTNSDSQEYGFHEFMFDHSPLTVGKSIIRAVEG